LDFGSGTGILLPFLREKTEDRIYAYEPEEHAQVIIEGLCNELDIQDVHSISSIEELKSLATSSIDTITALDVLEHVEQLEEVVSEFQRILKPDGVVVVCSPTESKLYKLMRIFGGKEYHLHYHFSNAEDVENCLAQFFNVHLETRIYPVFEFFRIVRCIH
jgi:2-polyprenyl-3-methyl-5-hydroxy-6-metoxy-1,4-benzoquinol methylase